MLNFIANPLGQFMYFIYNSMAFHNYGLAIIIFTIFIRLLILPLTIKQYRSTARMQQLQPQIQEIQKRYKNDKEKLQMEMMKFYQENKVNPAGSCLPLLIQMPILFSLWYVITKPFTHMLNVTDQQVEALRTAFNISKTAGYPQIDIIKQFSLDKVGNIISPDIAQKIADLKEGMHFIGLNLGSVPTWRLNLETLSWEAIGLLLLPIFATVTTFLSVRISMPKANQSNQNAQMAGISNTMMYVAPLMTLIFSFQFPAGLSLYWSVGYVIQIIQQLYINKHVLDKKEAVVK
ncbi:MAG: YidC/Oxa1 family membrane protein insertase [Clostridia bacterium]|nr:YidC/Oxa1 family membrane protein insertase [Clostridia bacterium]